VLSVASIKSNRALHYHILNTKVYLVWLVTVLECFLETEYKLLVCRIQFVLNVVQHGCLALKSLLSKFVFC